MKAIAERRRVTAVEFVPMPVRAALTVHPKGFRVFLKIEDAEDGTELKRRYDSEVQGQALPIKFRFSLAHELAHTLFYDLGTPDDRPQEIKEFRAGGGKTILANLEKYCSRIAGHLLMPSPVFPREILKLNTLQPRDLLPFAELRAAASVQSLVTRLGEEEDALISHGVRGCIAMVTSSAKGLFVKALAKPRSLNIAREIRSLRPGERWQICGRDGSSLFNGESEARTTLPLTIETRLSRERTEHELILRRYSSFQGEDSYLVYLVSAKPIP